MGKCRRTRKFIPEFVLVGRRTKSSMRHPKTDSQLFAIDLRNIVITFKIGRPKDGRGRVKSAAQNVAWPLVARKKNLKITKTNLQSICETSALDWNRLNPIRGAKFPNVVGPRLSREFRLNVTASYFCN